MIAANSPRLHVGYKLPDPIHPDSLVAAIEEVAARYPTAVTADGVRGSIVARVAVELGCSWLEVDEAEDLVTDLNEVHTPGGPLCFTGRALDYWSLLDDLSESGWTWETIARCISNLHNNYLNPYPPF